jgi:hypothetical protein
LDEAHIRNGLGYLSLTNEMRVAGILRDLQWQTTHSAFYTDPIQGKDREIDVVARRSLVHPKRDQHVHLNLIVECKSLKSEQVLLAELIDPTASEKLHASWIGADDDVIRAHIREIVEERGLDPRGVLRDFAEIAYPEGRAAIADLIPEAGKPPFRASAARESGADSGSGLLWNGIREVFSAIDGSDDEEIDTTLAAVKDDLSNDEGADVHRAIDLLRSATSTVSLFHPIVVCSATLVRVNDAGQMREAKWCRLVQSRAAVAPSRWLDLVNASAFEEYAAKLTDSYDRFFARRKCQRI